MKVNRTRRQCALVVHFDCLDCEERSSPQCLHVSSAIITYDEAYAQFARYPSAQGFNHSLSRYQLRQQIELVDTSMRLF